MMPILILHCGPMKTGSTAIQDLLHEQYQFLLHLGISYHHIRANNLLENLKATLDLELTRGHQVILLSSEFFAQTNPAILRKIVNDFPALHKYAIFVSRPLREIYPSLYLQNLKGSSCRTSSLRKFLNNQFHLDSNPLSGRVGQIMNFRHLDNNLVNAGFKTYWIAYSKSSLLVHFCSLLEDLVELSLGSLDTSLESLPSGTSPRRSLRMEVAFFARFINFLKKAQLINDFTRRTLLIFLLNISDFLRYYYPRETCLSIRQREMCDKIDQATNAPFLKSKPLFDGSN